MKTRQPLHQIAAVAGTVHVQRRLCGRPTCRCRCGHLYVGHYFFWRESGRLRKRYVTATEVGAVRAACDERRRGNEHAESRYGPLKSTGARS